MIREVLDRIGREYLTASKEAFTGHPLGPFINSVGPKIIAEALKVPKLELWGGHGVSGKWSAVPWIGVFDPAASDSAQRGFYLVYLFSADMKHVYLSMNQGTTAISDELGQGKKALARLASVAEVMRNRVPKYRERFNDKPIDLASINFFPRGYEAGHAFGTTYDLTNLPDEQTLVDDLVEAVRLYRRLILVGGGDILSEEDADDAGIADAPIEERRRYVAHRKIERNPTAGKAAKKVHGYICQGCDFNFSGVYGEFASGYIEAHHLIPLSSIPEGETVSLDPKTDFSVLCANCHRMVHRKGGPKTMEELRALPGIQKIRDAMKG